jgi:hypothetical protein
MKNSRFQFEYRDSASKFHCIVGDCLRSSTIFGNYQIFQEYPVNLVNPAADPALHFDWVIPDIFLIYECHGRQHYEPVIFGGDIVNALFNFQSGQRRDKLKKSLALEAGYTLVEIPYTDEKLITEQYLWNKYIEFRNNNQSIISMKNNTPELEYKEKQKQIRKDYLVSDKHTKELEQARQYRKEQYAKAKRLKSNA